MFKIVSMSLILLLLSIGLKKQTLTILLSLEFMSIMIIWVTLMQGLDIFYGLMMVCIGACEGAIGLSILISMTRTMSLNV